MMLLVLTGSKDGTADILFSRIGTKAFRFNYDIFSDYAVAFQPSSWSIENPTGLKIDGNTATSAFWWKALNYFVDEEDFIDEWPEKFSPPLRARTWSNRMSRCYAF